MPRIVLFCLFALLLIGCSPSNRVASTIQSDGLDTIPVELTTHMGEQLQFVEGDDIQFLLSLGQDAFIYMFYIDADNRVVQLLPSPEQPSNFYAAGYFLTIPEYKNLYRFTVNKPFGEESIWVLASDQSINPDQSLRDIDKIRGNIKLSSQRAYGEYELRISTREKSRF